MSVPEQPHRVCRQFLPKLRRGPRTNLGLLGTTSGVVRSGVGRGGRSNRAALPPEEVTVSVVIPVFNRASLIERAVNSVLAQTYAPLEVLVVDDGSTDGTQEVVRVLAQADPRVVLLEQEHGGAPTARNLGIARAKGLAIAFQDSDDVWMSDFLETLVGSYRTGRIVFSSFERVSLDGTSEILPRQRRMRFVRYRLKYGNVISTQTTLIDRALLQKFTFDTRLPRLQDWDLWLSMAREAKFVHVNEVLARQYVQADSISSNPGALVEGLRTILNKHRIAFLTAPTSLVRHRAFVRRWDAQQRSRQR